MKKIFCFIFARGGSKRIPNKNLKKIGNKTLLEISIELAKQIKKIKKIFVSSDSVKILELAKKKNIDVIKRPKNLCTSKSNEFKSWKHAIKHLNQKKIFFDYFLSLPTTSPLRSIKDINKMIIKFSKYNYDLLVCIAETNRFPNYNMVLRTKNEIQPIIKDNNKINRKNMFDLTTIGYLAKTKFILKSNNIFDGKVGYIKIPRERALDINDFYDLKIAKFLFNEKK
jgi:N,N'-diacetyl-8-epilegionaminate cytidylyltransferase